MKLSTLLEGVEILAERGEGDPELKSVAYDSRRVGEDSLFVAIRGEIADGHRYAKSAVDKGAVVLIVNEFLEELPVRQILVSDSRKALARISCNFYEEPSKALILVGVTATNGKTSTTSLLAHLMTKAGMETGLIGTIAYKIKGKVIPAELTTPESLELQGLFRELVDAGVDYAVMEVSSAAQEMNRTYGTDFNIVCMNNISREHIDQHGNFENYWMHKKKLITEAKPESVALLNLDDERVRSLRDKTAARVVTYGISDRSGDLYADNIDLTSGFAHFDLVVAQPFLTAAGSAPVGRYPIRLSVAGFHSVVNGVSAIALALLLGISMDSICESVAGFMGVERRFQLIHDGNFLIVDDHFANAGNIDVTLTTMEKMAYNRLYVLYAIRGNRGVTVNGENVDTFAPRLKGLRCDTFIATESRESVTDHDKVSFDERKIFEKKMKEHGVSYEMCGRLDEAVGQVLDRAQDGDLVLFAGCQGMDYGAKCALEHLSATIEADKLAHLKKVMEDRIAGV